MAAPPPPAPPPVRAPSQSGIRLKQAEGALAQRAQQSLSWRTGKGSLYEYSLEVRGHTLEFECKPQTGESETATGTTIWDCAIVSVKYLDEFCTAHPADYWNNKKVLEVGSGTGLVGVASTLYLHGAELIITDLPCLTPLIQRNLERNQKKLGEVMMPNVSVQPFTWGTPPTMRPPPPYDVILVSDCVWPKIDNSLLVGSLRDVTDLNTLVILIFEFRHQSCRTTFFKLAENFFNFERVDDKQMTYCPDDIEIYHIRRKPEDYPNRIEL